jgi:DNA-binding transcriptional ArsR family regulator
MFVFKPDPVSESRARDGQSSRHDWAAIRAYYESGHTLKQCRALFGFSNGAWASAVNRGDVVPRRGGSGGDPAVTATAVAALLAEGVSRAEIARQLAVSKSTVTYHATRLGFAAAPVRRYDWVEVQQYYDAGHSISECQKRFGFARASFMDAVKRGAIASRPAAPPVTDYLVRGVRRNRGNLKRRLIAAGIKENSCERCGISDWQG